MTTHGKDDFFQDKGKSNGKGSNVPLLGGVMERAHKLACYQGGEPLIDQTIQEKVNEISKPSFMSEKMDHGFWELLRNFGIYFFIRLVLQKYSQAKATAAE